MVCLPRRRVIPALQRLVCPAEEDLCAFAVQMELQILLSTKSRVSVILLGLCRRGW